MADATESVKNTLNELLRQLGDALRERTKHVGDMNKAIKEATDEHQPLIDALDMMIKNLVDQTKMTVKLHLKELFPPTRKNDQLKLPLGVIKLSTSDYKHDVVDEAGVQALVKADGGDDALDVVAPAVRKTKLTPLKNQFSELLAKAIALGLIERTGGEQVVTATPNDADVKGGPSLSRAI